jgi:2,4-dienoyl-CoA reductase-like NADH-dependent reductase (Old Yellow Enzyme family)
VDSRRPVVDLAPINTGMYLRGEPTDQSIRFFRLRSGQGVAVCFVGNVGVIPELTPNDSTGLIGDTYSWHRLCEEIRSAGSSPGIQLSCTPPGYRPRRALERNALEHEETERYRALLRAVPRGTWGRIEQAFLDSIRLSQELGFEHIQVHAAHGYLFSLVLDPIVNDARIGLDVLRNILQAVVRAKNVKGSLRVSWRAGLANDGLRAKAIEDFWQPFRKELRLDISAGYYNIDKSLIYPSREAGEAPLLGEAVALAERYRDSRISVAGNVWNPFAMPPLPDNLSLAIARGLIADPDHLKRMADGQAMVCDHCNKCHYFSRNLPYLVCPKWPGPVKR